MQDLNRQWQRNQIMLASKLELIIDSKNKLNNFINKIVIMLILKPFFPFSKIFFKFSSAKKNYYTVLNV